MVNLTGKRISVEEGLSSNQLYDIEQDERGFIWVGTTNGLCRHDGYTFVNFPTINTGNGITRGDVGTFIPDTENHLMWMRTSTFHYACYDVQQESFMNFWGSCDPQKTYQRFITEANGIWMYEEKTGIRHVTYKNGQFRCTDFTKENGKLPESRIKRLTRGNNGSVWILTNKGLYLITSNGTVKTILPEGDFIVGKLCNDKFFFATKDRRIAVYDNNAHLVKSTQIPAIYGELEGETNSIIWRGQWILMSRNTVIAIDLEDYHIHKPAEIQIEGSVLLDNIDDNYLISDRQQTLWLLMKDGSFKKMNLLHDSFSNVRRRRRYSTARGDDGKFYIASYGNGLFIYDPKTDTTDHYTANDTHPLIATNYLNNAYVDKKGCVWIGQEGAGMACLYKLRQPDIQHLAPVHNLKGELVNHIQRLTLQPDGNVLVNTMSSQMFLFDTHSNTFKSNGIAPQTARTRIDSLTDAKGRTWISTWEEGIIMREHDKEQHFLTRNIVESRINVLVLDARQHLWLATNNGLYTIDTHQDTIDDSKFRHYTTKDGLPSDNINCLMTAKDGSLWVSGQGSGIAKCHFNEQGHITVQQITAMQGQASTNIYSLTEDLHGNIWAGTENTIVRIQPQDMQVSVYQTDFSLLGNLVADNCALTLPDGRLLFGTHDGIHLITPSDEEEQEKTDAPRAFITNIDINGTAALPSFVQLQQEGLTLANNENSLTLYFSNFDYAHLGQTLYQYYLEGIDHDWREPTALHSVDYGNLPPGRYTFHLRTNENGEETTLSITIRQPWYNTWWAWLLYLIIIGSAIGTFVHHKQEQFALQQQMIIEKQISEFRIGFFTQVAHEFRTPLAIISGAIDKMTESGQTPRKPTQTAKRGIRRLTQLVNQLMEFRKVNTDNLRLQVEQGDLVSFIRNIYQDFWTSAQQKEQNISFQPFDKTCQTVFDQHIIDTIVYNLLSNAIKYTPQHGTVSVRLRKDDNHLLFTVEDSGPGIDKDREQQLFLPFMHGYASQGGMGIGLYTAYKMAQTHKGSLSYERSEEFGGSKFTLTLPADDSLYAADDYKSLTAIETAKQDKAQEEPAILEMLPQALNDYRIAIIEDDPDMLEQIKTEMGIYFCVNGYTNGQTALDAIRRDQPKLIICDVMLPDINGYDIVKTLKADVSLRNIPIIMLTALDDERHQIKGYEAGADDYMVKPCNYRILLARVVQLIKWSLASQEPVEPSQDATIAEKQEGTMTEVTDTNSTDAKPILTSQADKRFLEKVKLIIAQRVSDPDFTIDQMAEQMKMGRTKLYGKMKELTGMSPNKLLISERMRIAAELLEEGNLNIAEIGYRVGIQDASYFNKCFKAHFGMAPSKYRKQ